MLRLIFNTASLGHNKVKETSEPSMPIDMVREWMIATGSGSSTAQSDGS